MAISTTFLGIRIDEMEPDEAIEQVRAEWATGRKQRVYFVNAHCANIACRDERYQEALAQAELVLADGSGVLSGARLLGLPIKHNLNGTDLGPKLCARAAQEGRSVFLLGGEPGVAEQAAAQLLIRCPGLHIVGIQHGFFSAEEEAAVIAHINAARPDLLFVAMGVPRQELWITRHWEKLDVGTALAVGALFDFLAERFKRAPVWMRRLGVEWVFRLIQEPGRLWRRYLIGNLTFESRALLAALNPAKRRAGQQVVCRPVPMSRPVAPLSEPALSTNTRE
jgi:N-acetylglucosaminyldiphosphoundecaprenol N-acetyl-beta-D-mannosaminyltransferase